MAIIKELKNEEEEDRFLNNKPEPSFFSTLLSASAFEWLAAVGFIMGGCCSNAYFLELIVKDAPSSGQLITFVQFLLMAIEGFITNLEFSPSGMPKLKERNIPLTRWFLMVILFYSSSLLNNIAFGFDIPMILHIVFRSASLFANMFMGWLILKKSYNLKQTLSIASVTIGVIITTLNTVQHKSGSTHDTSVSQQLIGLTILTLALFLASGLGLLQEVTYKQYGKHWKESLFYTHFLSIPLFLPFAGDITKSVIDYFTSDPITLRGIAGDLLNLVGITKMPKLILFLIGNVITQYFCVSGVHRLSTLSSALVLNLVLTLRKMVSIIISVVYLGTPVNSQFILGAVLAFGGAFAFSMAKSTPVPTKEEDKKKKQ